MPVLLGLQEIECCYYSLNSFVLLSGLHMLYFEGATENFSLK